MSLSDILFGFRREPPGWPPRNGAPTPRPLPEPVPPGSGWPWWLLQNWPNLSAQSHQAQTWWQQFQNWLNAVLQNWGNFSR